MEIGNKWKLEIGNWKIEIGNWKLIFSHEDKKAQRFTKNRKLI